MNFLTKIHASFSSENMAQRCHRKKLANAMMSKNNAAEKRITRILKKLTSLKSSRKGELETSAPSTSADKALKSSDSDENLSQSQDAYSIAMRRTCHLHHNKDFRANLMEVMRRFVVTKETVTRLGGRCPVTTVTITRPERYRRVMYFSLWLTHSPNMQLCSCILRDQRSCVKFQV